MAKNKYSTWSKNFGQSVKFGAKDILTEMAPAISETATTMAEDMRELKKDLRNLRANKRQVINYLLGEDENFSKYIKIGAKNFKSSYRTGKLIDPKREDKLVMQAMGMDDSDFDFGDNDDFDIDSGSNEVESGSFADYNPTKVVNVMGPSSESMNHVSMELGKNTTAIHEGFVTLEKSNKNNFTMSEALSKRYHTETMSTLSSIDSNLANIIKFNNESISTFVTASMEFYDKNLEVLNSINEAMLRLSPVPTKKEALKKEQNPFEQFMMGGFSLNGYSQVVAKNARKAFQNSLLGAMAPMLNQEMILASLASNPLGFFLKEGMGMLIPDKFKQRVTKFDESVQSFVPALLSKLGHYKGDNSLIELFSEVFGIKTTTDTRKFKQNEFEQGPIPYDGESKVALTRVIPGYLSRLVAINEIMAKALTGKGGDKLEKEIGDRIIVYNYNAKSYTGGNFMRRNEAQKIARNEMLNAVSSEYRASWDLESNARNASEANGMDQSEVVRNFFLGLTLNDTDEFHPGDLEQIKSLIHLGATGKNPTAADLKSKKLAQQARIIKEAWDKLSNDKQMATYGANRHAARVAYNNMNAFKGSDEEHGSGQHAWQSQLHEGSAGMLYSDKNLRQKVDYEYHIERLEDGSYYMPEEYINKYNKDKYKGARVFNRPRDIYKDILKNKGMILNDDDTITRLKGNVAENKNLVVLGPDGKPVEPGTGNNPPSVEGSMKEKITALVTAPFNKVSELLDFIDTKMHEVIFGKNGLGSNLLELILGKKDKDGRYSGGWFSEAINTTKDSYESAKTYLFGGTDKNGKEVDGVLSKPLAKFTGLMDEYIFGEKERDKDGNVKKKPSIIDRMETTLVHGFGQLASVLFGRSGKAGDRKKSLADAKAAFNKAIPDIGKGMGLGVIVGTVSGFGGFGLLGSLFLPGGPIGGALVGGAMGLLSQSKSFREMIFGREVLKNGKIHKVGGLFSERVQNFFKRKKVPILGGAAMASISTFLGHGVAFGLMPTMAIGAFGPVITGAAWGLMSHSKKFREIFFGKEIKDKDGNVVRRVGGLISDRMIRTAKITLPRTIAGSLTGMASMGVLSQFGLVGSMIATGPIPAAIMGAAMGIASGSKSFTEYMFGYTDKSGEYHSGAMDRFKNYFTWEIMEPMKLYLRENVFKGKMWARRYIYAPLREAFIPLKFTIQDIGAKLSEALKIDSIAEGFHYIFRTVAEHIASVMKPVIDMTKSIAHWTIEKFKSAMETSIKLALLPLRAIGGILRWAVEGRDYKSSVLTAARGVGNALMTGAGFVGAVGNLGKAILHPSDEDSRMKKFRESEAKQRRIEEKAFAKGSMRFADARRRLEEQQRKIRANGYNLTDDQVQDMKRRELEKAAELESVKEQISKGDDLGNKMLASISDGQAEANDYLSQMNQLAETQKEFNTSENGLFYTTMAGVRAGIEKIGFTPEKMHESLNDILEETVHPWLDTVQDAVTTPVLDVINNQIVNRQDVSNLHLKSIDENISNLFTYHKSVFSPILDMFLAMAGAKSQGLLQSTLRSDMVYAGRAGFDDEAEYTALGSSRTGTLMLGVGAKGKKQMNAAKWRDQDLFNRAALATSDNIYHNDEFLGDSSIIKALQKRDDNAQVVDEQNKAKKEHQEEVEREEKKTTFLSTIATWCKNNLRDKKKDKPSWLEKILNWGGTLLGAVWTVAKFGSVIAGIVGGISSLLAFTFGGDDTKRRLTDSEAFGNIATRIGRGVARKFPKAVETIGKYGFAGARYAARTAGGAIKRGATTAFEKLSEKVTTGWNVAKSAESNRGLIANVMQKLEDAIKWITDSSLFKKLSGTGEAAKRLKGFITGIPKTVAKLMRQSKTSHMLLVALKKSKATIAKGVAKAVAGGLTGGVLTAAFGAYDFASGASRAGFFFDVADEDVDDRMRLCAALVNTIFGLPGMFVFDVSLSLACMGSISLAGTPIGHALQELGLDLNNADHRKIFAQALYRLTSEEADTSKLDEAQKKLLSEYEAHLKEKGLTRDQLSLEQFQSDVKGQGGFWKNFGAPILNRVLGIDRNKHKSFMELVEDKFNGLVDWFKKSVDEILKFNPLTWLKDKFFSTTFGKRLEKFWNEPWLNEEGRNKAKSNNAAIDKTGKKLTDTFGRDVDEFSADGNGVPRMNDPRWANMPFDGGKFKDKSCGPMTLAMLTGIDPRTAAKMATPFAGSGVRSDFFRNAAAQMNIPYRENKTPKDVMTALQMGPTVMGGRSSNPNSPFYGDGHYVVANGLTRDGKVHITNPTGAGKDKNIDIRQLMKETIGSGGYSGSFAGGAEGYVDEDTAAGNGISAAPSFIQDRLIDAAKSFLHKGIKYSQEPGRLEPEISGYTDCSGYVSAIFKKVFGRDILTPYAGEFNDPSRPGQWNESVPIDESLAQPGDFVFWETEDGVPDNHIGMVVDPVKHLAVASNTSTGPIEFQWDNSYWKPMFTGIRRPKIFAGLDEDFSGSGNGRMTLADVAKLEKLKPPISTSDEKGKIPTAADLKKLEEEQQKAAEKPTSTADFKRLSEQSEKPGAEAAKETAKKAAETKKDSKTDKIDTKASTSGNREIGLLELITGFGLGLKNLFSSVLGNTSYKWVTRDQLFGGLKSLIGSGASGAAQKKLKEAAESFLNKGIKYSMKNPGRLDPDTSGYTDCSGLTAAIYKKAFGKDILTPYGGEFDDPDRKGQWNESDAIDEKNAQIGDLVFWETKPGIPDNHVGMVLDPRTHTAIASNTSTGPKAFQWDDSYWKPMFTGIRRPKFLASLGGDSGETGDVSGGDPEIKKNVWNYLVNKLGMNREGAAGVMGNIQQESGFRLGAIGDNGTSGGLVQWHDYPRPGIGRFTNLKSYASSIGKPWDTVDAQLGYLSQELNNDYKSVYDNVSKAESVQDAVNEWVRHFEKPQNMDEEVFKRTKLARAYYNDTETFAGGANGFMSGSSGNILGALLGNKLGEWKQRYDARGAAKKLGLPKDTFYRNMEALTRRSNDGYVPLAPTQIATNVARATILPSKVDTGGATMDDLLLSIRALDSHSELREIIAYLAAIANNGGTGSSKSPLSNTALIQMQRTIEGSKKGLRDAKNVKTLGNPRMAELTNAMENYASHGGPMMQLAMEIATGGNFKN